MRLDKYLKVSRLIKRRTSGERRLRCRPRDGQRQTRACLLRSEGGGRAGHHAWRPRGAGTSGVGAGNGGKERCRTVVSDARITGSGIPGAVVR